MPVRRMIGANLRESPAVSTPINTRHADCHVFLVEDEDSLRQDLSFLLQHRGYQVTACASAAEFYRHFAVKPASVVVLDIGLEGEDGLSICKHLRSHNPLLGIIFLTARGLRDDRVHGLMTGADAYMVKPVELDELCLTIDRLEDRLRLAQVNSLSAVSAARAVADVAPARPAPAVAEASEAAPSPMVWSFELGTGLITAPNGKSRRLTGNERTVVYALSQRDGQAVSVEELAVQLLIANPAEAKHRVEVIVSRLRRSVEQAVEIPLPLYLLRGTGYCLRDVRVVED
ncbi:response regulator transcription factor [Ideonella paludis]|uniref:response regulator transcription factor n=2 Tax=Ideonella paludis TaxID=1233411 RepID=UPI001B382BE6|nr:response regulator transcription factor [Ideonella paludis]